MLRKAFNDITKVYCPLSALAIEDWMARTSVVSLKKGHQVVKEGQYADQLYFILTGSMRAYYFKDGKDITDWFAFENDFVSSISSFFLDIPSEHYMELIEDSTLLEFKRADMALLSEKHHDIERLARLSITKTMLKLQRRIVSLQFKTSKQRYYALLQEHPEIELRVPLGHIASYLGITQETLSRIRASR